MKRMQEPSLGKGGTALALGLLLASCLPTKKDEDRSGSGTELGNVVGSIYTADSRPAAGITVTLYPADDDSTRIKEAVTDAGGAYSFQGVSGSYRLVTLDGQGNGLQVDSVQPDGESQLDLDRRQMAPLGGLAGYSKVINPQGVAKVQLRLAASPFKTLVDPNSGFDWSGLPAGRYWLEATYPGARYLEIPVIIESGETTTLADSLFFEFHYSAGFNRRDTVKVSSSQLPLEIMEKLVGNGGMVDSVYWVLNGDKIPFSMHDTTALNFKLEAGMLHDTGFNVLELRLFRKDTTSIRVWYIDLDDSPVIPWARQAVRAIFQSKEADPRENTAGQILGTFRILEHRVLGEDEMEFWKWSPVAGGVSALPDLVKIPMNPFNYEGATQCPEVSGVPPAALFPGDTVTFLTAPDAFHGGKAMHIRTDVAYADLAHGAWFAQAEWPLADYYARGVKFTSRGLTFGSNALQIRLVRNYWNGVGTSACTPLSRGFNLGADGAAREYVATPAGIGPSSLLLHYRASMPRGLFADAIASAGDYVYIDSSGKGVAGSDAARREVQLSAAEVAELRGLLADLPSVMPWEWDRDFLEDTTAVPQTSRYLLSGGRGALLSAAPHAFPVPQAKTDLFQAVDAWLRDHNLL